ncbi:DUF4331 domain-containing protein [Fulvivirga sp. RKSG066]|uniref:DUF4331 family protein n=1 Tax=Fulvivirga aurantia TaxID=2529383 RepID=UPI0012BBBBDF|nr:DUF4331 family protein [Fulvivirga aurantia]MTI21840.1 DUF4331 domain-containing protein [Fulvivirga aurantia]
MKTRNIISALSLSLLLISAGCGDDDSNDVMREDAPMAEAGQPQTVDLEKMVTLDASASVGQSIAFNWIVTDPNGNVVALNNATSAEVSFVASVEGTYDAVVAVTNSGGTEEAMTTVTAVNPTFTSCDQMGRPAINTVFNYFGDAEAKNNYNQTTPNGGNAAVADFEFILDNLQEYIGLNSDTYVNILGLNNTETAGVLTVDVLTSDKTKATSYGTLNGRALGDDVIDVTLILTFDDQSGNSSPLIPGLISDNVDANDKEFSNSFPYLASPH